VAEPSYLSCAHCSFKYDHKEGRTYGHQFKEASEMIACWRYPEPLPVAAGHWCGEYRLNPPPDMDKAEYIDRRNWWARYDRDERAERIRLGKVAKKLRKELRELKATME
jgi:hypothetical protein|tara:strand:- start:17 stop:343 length:327 start_codon:yes stop_codon:yes gene_type:complete